MNASGAWPSVFYLASYVEHVFIHGKISIIKLVSYNHELELSMETGNSFPYLGLIAINILSTSRWFGNLQVIV